MSRRPSLNAEQIEFIKNNLSLPAADLAHRFNVSVATIYKYKRNLRPDAPDVILDPDSN